MLDYALEGLPGQVETVEFGVAAFEPGDHAQGLGVVVEAAIGRQHRVERLLAGVPEGAVAQIVRERHRLRQVFVEGQRARRGAGDLRHLQGMGQAGAEMIAFVVDEHLGLVLQPAERGAVDDPIAIALKRASKSALGLEVAAAAAVRRIARVRRQRPAGVALETEAAV